MILLGNGVSPSARQRSRIGTVMSTTAISTAVVLAAGASAFAQNAPVRPAQGAADAASVEEVVVTGSRIVREGYEAPTPLTVVSTEQLEKRADASIADFLNTMPAVAGSYSTTSTQQQIAGAIAGIQALNLRALGQNRVLVLIDGQRTVPSSYTGGLVDTGNFPSQLMARVDVVTGGASAVYGSDAVAGVVNFVLDRKFTGVKGELSGGLTNYGDSKNYKVNLSAGFGFGPDDRGHVLLSGEHYHTDGITGDGGRDWNRTGYLDLTNPTYTATNGQPQTLFLPNSALSAGTAGGIIISGPLKGTAFGAGGTPYKFNYGPIVSGQLMSGGDAQANDMHQYDDVEPKQSNDNIFTRLSYDITDNLTVFGQWIWSQNQFRTSFSPVWMPGSATTNYIIRNDNAYLPASVRTAMATTGITNFAIGSWNLDMPRFGNIALRITNRFNTGLEGKFDALDTTWHWNAYYAYGATKISLTSQFTPVTARYRQAIDAVVSPTTGQIVCRITLTDPTSGCRPWNAMGIGVNAGNTAALTWMNDGKSFQRGLIEQTTMAASVNGEPFSIWAGPVSLALSFEHRTDEIHVAVDRDSAAGGRIVGNYPALDGKQSVTEGAVESIVPLAKGESWAQSWDLSLAARFTGYQYAGYVTTWKVGTTYAPIDDIKFRLTRSRDIRAPNIQEAFAVTAITTPGSTLIDRFLNNASTPSTTQNYISGNPNLVPEKADTTGIGVVLQPRFLEGFTASVDYWDVDIGGAIEPIAAQQVIDTCYDKRRPDLCVNIIRDPVTGQITRVNSSGINLANLDVRGIDLEATYGLPMSRFVDDWRGNFSLHGNMTFYLRKYRDNTLVPPTDSAGQNGADTDPPNWKLTVTATYQLDPVTVALTGRAISSGTFNNAAIVCTSGCPASTTAAPTRNYNYVPGAFYLDANVNYKLNLGEATESDLFLSVRNIFNHSKPPIAPGSFWTVNGQTAVLYDALGTVYRVGLRFKM